MKNLDKRKLLGVIVSPIMIMLWNHISISIMNSLMRNIIRN